MAPAPRDARRHTARHDPPPHRCRRIPSSHHRLLTYLLVARPYLSLSLSSTTCSARTSPSTILRHRPLRSPASERASDLKPYSPFTSLALMSTSSSQGTRATLRYLKGHAGRCATSRPNPLSSPSPSPLALTTHHSPLTTNHSPTDSPLTPTHSPLTHQPTTHHSPLTTHHSPLTTHHSPLNHPHPHPNPNP